MAPPCRALIGCNLMVTQAGHHHAALAVGLGSTVGTEASVGGPGTPDRSDIHEASGAEDDVFDDDRDSDAEHAFVGEEDNEEDEDDVPPDDSDFLNFSFKNLELLGERNKEMAERMSALRAEVGSEDPYSHSWLPALRLGQTAFRVLPPTPDGDPVTRLGCTFMCAQLFSTYRFWIRSSSCEETPLDRRIAPEVAPQS